MVLGVLFSQGLALGWYVIFPRVLPWAGMSCPFGVEKKHPHSSEYPTKDWNKFIYEKL
jgi:hypothetical protein